MSKQIEYETISYTVDDNDTVEDLLKKPGFFEAHAKNLSIKADQLIQPSFEEKKRKEEETEKSGFLTALLAGMSNDQGYQMAWLARKRFPNLLEQEGKDPVDYYFVDEDEDISYVDPYTGRVVKEFKEGLFSDVEDASSIIPSYDVMDTAGMFGPTGQFLAETIAGTGAMTAGGFTFGLPGAVVGGGGGTYAGGQAAYAGRAGISAAFDGPPLNVAKKKDELRTSVAFGALPFGSFGAKGLTQVLGSVKSKFVGDEGLTALQSIVREGGKTVDDKISYAQDNFGITLTRGEAEGIMNNAAQLQRYLQMQPGSQKLWDFYHNRALQVEEVADEFFDKILSGSLLRKRGGIDPKTGEAKGLIKQLPLTGKSGLTFEEDVAEVADRVLKELAKKRESRAGKVYENAYELDIEIDVSDLAQQLRAELGDANLVGPAREVREKMLDALTDKSGFSKTGLKNNTEMLHNALRYEFRPLIESLTKDGAKSLKRDVSQIREKLSNKLKALNPEYLRATEIYDPTKGHLQLLQKSIINNFAKAVEIGGQRAAQLTKRLFSGEAKEKEITDLRRLLEADDPQVWQNMKGNWLRTQLDEAIATTSNPLGAPNKFLRSVGFSGRARQSFNEFLKDNPQITKAEIDSGKASRLFREESLANMKVRGRKAQALKAIMDPQELQNFVDLVEMMQATSFIATRSSSPTQPFLVIQKLLDREVTGLGRVAGTALRAVFEIPQRFLVRGFDDLAKASLSFQREAYEDQLIQALIDPAFAEDLAKSIAKVKPLVYFVSQAVARGGESALSDLAEGDFGRIEDDRLIRGSEGEKRFEAAKEANRIMRRDADAERQKIEESIQTLSEPRGFGPPLSDLFSPLPQTPGSSPSNLIDSPTLLPSDQDRELARRLQGGIGGLGAIA
jgi:hypothetical protein